MAAFNLVHYKKIPVKYKNMSGREAKYKIKNYKIIATAFHILVPEPVNRVLWP